MAVVYRSRSLAKDVSRCIGTNCKTKRRCARYKQMERDREVPPESTWGWVPVLDALANGEECVIRIEET